MANLKPSAGPDGKMSRRVSSSSIASGNSAGGDLNRSVFNDSAIEIKGLANTELKEEDKATAMMF